MDEIKSLVESKIKQLLKEVNDNEAEMSFGMENDYFYLISKYMYLLKGIGE